VGELTDCWCLGCNCSLDLESATAQVIISAFIRACYSIIQSLTTYQGYFTRSSYLEILVIYTRAKI